MRYERRGKDELRKDKKGKRKKEPWRRDHSYMIIHECADGITSFCHHSSAGRQMLSVVIKGMSVAFVRFFEMLLIIRFVAEYRYSQ